MPQTPMIFDGVERLTDTGLGGNYRIGGRVIFIGSSLPLIGATVYGVGGSGRIVLPRWFVEQHQLAGGREAD